MSQRMGRSMRTANKVVGFFASLVWVATTTNVFAEDELPVPDDDFIYCTTCHGVQLVGNPILRARRMSGVEACYVEQQLISYKNEWRGAHEGDIDNGKRLYGTCSACLAVTGEGNEALGSPSLTKTSDWYLVSQLQNFEIGNRGGHSADSYGMQMRAAAQLLSDDGAINDVVKYISTL